MQNKIKIYHIDDHTLFIQGVFSLIGKEPKLEWLGSANDAETGKLDIQNLKPDVILLDYFLPDSNGLETAQQILTILPNTSILILSMETSPELIKKCQKNGIMGFLPKTTDRQNLLNAIISIHNKVPVFPEIFEESKNSLTGLDLLSKREKEIALLIAQGYTSAQISEKLFLSLLTVNTHRRNLINKLKLNNTAQLSAWISKLDQKEF